MLFMLPATHNICHVTTVARCMTTTGDQEYGETDFEGQLYGSELTIQAGSGHDL